MSILVSVNKLTKSFDSRPLFDNLTFAIEAGDRIGLIGPNGAGKTTLLKVLASEILADDGEVILPRGTRISYLEQKPSFNLGATVLSTLLEKVDDPHDWEAIVKAEELLWKLQMEEAGITGDAQVDSLSGGWKKRLALARELMRNPDVLLMDEPTNHLDVESIIWLENLIRSASFATLTITHDRLFLQRISNRILELDRRHAGGILSLKGDYATYLEIKESLMTAQENREAILKGNLRRETEWMKQGAKARTTKQQARQKRHAELSGEVSELSSRNVERKAQMEFQAIENSPKRLIEVKKLSKAFGSRKLFSDLELCLTPGTRLGILGANGCGKSTLIRVLLGLEKPDSGKIFRSDQLRISYFEQNRDTLDPEVSLMRTICPFGDHVFYRGKQTHIRSYLDRFMFNQNQMDMNVGRLSGGEQSRVLIAKLMLQEANLIVLDEPTNDLDIPTLNVLQECLVNFEGAILLVSHDRYFLDQVSTEILAFPHRIEDRKLGKIHLFADLAQWEVWYAQPDDSAKKIPSAAISPSKPLVVKKPNKDLESLTKKIERAEAEYARLALECEKPDVSSDLEKLSKLGEQMKVVQDEISSLFKNWEALADT